MSWRFHRADAGRYIGLIPEIVQEHDKRKLAEQIDDRYAHGGGWMPMEKWVFHDDCSIQYPGDEEMRPVARYFHSPTGETLFVYEDAWVAIQQVSGKYEVSRMD